MSECKAKERPHVRRVPGTDDGAPEGGRCDPPLIGGGCSRADGENADTAIAVGVGVIVVCIFPALMILHALGVI